MYIKMYYYYLDPDTRRRRFRLYYHYIYRKKPTLVIDTLAGSLTYLKFISEINELLLPIHFYVTIIKQNVQFILLYS